ncbi:right-handed parallel beta-helix repeat-containing protein, partial [Collinsella tanakaei]|uniref:right-handed parallel beta-helix repeat-containing protein n=1 Tax=Collinsella tanakaei TaxID=626935 RepID=UPI001959130A
MAVAVSCALATPVLAAAEIAQTPSPQGFNVLEAPAKGDAGTGAAGGTETESDGSGTQATTARALEQGVNVISSGATGEVFDIDEGKALMISGQHASEGSPIVFTDCAFNLSGETVKLSGTQTDENGNSVAYNNGEAVAKLWVGGNVEFHNCTFITEEGASRSTTAGYDAAIYFYNGMIDLYGCTLKAEGYNGQFLGFYGPLGDDEKNPESVATFDGCTISTVDNKNGWSYAMYAGAVLKLQNKTTMSATGSTTTGSGNINCFYSGDNRTGYDAIYVDNSTIDFHDNHAGGFAINNVNIHVTNGSEIKVNDNLGNACNSGMWYVENSTLQINGNRGGHGLSCIGFEMTNSKLEVMHNGYAGVYIQSTDSKLTNCTVDLRCNGELLLSYTAGDLWLNGHKLTVEGGSSDAQPGSPWLGGVGRKGAVDVKEGTTVVAYDLNSNAADSLKNNTEAVLSKDDLALDPDGDAHTLFLNPFMESDYARGNAESNKSDNDADLFEDQKVGSQITDDETGETFTADRNYIIGGDTAKIDTLTTAQLSHHKYDWENGEITEQAAPATYGVKRYECTDACSGYVDHTTEHPESFNCEHTYVYAPLVGVTFDENLPAGYTAEDVTGMPDDQTAIEYNGTASEPVATPVLERSESGEKLIFTGWYADEDCKTPFDFTIALTDNWTVVYAGWQKETGIVEVKPADITVYMGGAEGYEGVIDDIDDGTYTESNSLPEPGFYFYLPTEINEALKDAGVTDTDSETADLSKYMRIYTNGYTVDGEPVQLNWKLEKYGNTYSGAHDKYIYRIVPEPVGEQEAIPVRLQFTSEDGTTFTNDTFEPNASGALYEQYTMQLYNQLVATDQVVFEVDTDGFDNATGDKFYSGMKLLTGILTIRYVTGQQGNVVTSVVTEDQLAAAVEANPDSAHAVHSDTAKFFINGSDVDVTDSAAPSLLFDDVVTSGNTDGAQNYDEQLSSEAVDAIEEKLGENLSVDGYEAKYLDLVDANNGNAWLRASEDTTVYWRYPKDTDKNTEFHLVHFKGLDREILNGNIASAIAEAETEVIEVENTDYGVRFTTDGFSPFVLVWGDTVPDTPDTPDTPDPD